MIDETKIKKPQKVTPALTVGCVRKKTMLHLLMVLTGQSKSS